MKHLAAACLLVLATAVAADPVPDPMRPPDAPVSAVAGGPAAPVVSAVFVSGTRRVAVVDGRLVHAGDRVGDCEVAAVDPRGLTCRGGAVLAGPRTLNTDPAAPPGPAVAANGETP